MMTACGSQRSSEEDDEALAEEEKDESDDGIDRSQSPTPTSTHLLLSKSSIAFPWKALFRIALLQAIREFM